MYERNEKIWEKLAFSQRKGVFSDQPVGAGEVDPSGSGWDWTEPTWTAESDPNNPMRCWWKAIKLNPEKYHHSNHKEPNWIIQQTIWNTVFCKSRVWYQAVLFSAFFCLAKIDIIEDPDKGDDWSFQASKKSFWWLNPQNPRRED